MVSVTASLVRDVHGGIRSVIAQVEDVTERRLAEERLVYQAGHDALTDLPNRMLLVDRLDHALSRRARIPERLVGVIFLDLDNFKTVNDALGHAVGDALLISVSQLIAGLIRPSDTVARFGGDEFVLALEDPTDVGQAEALARRISSALRQQLSADGKQLMCSVSMGLAISASQVCRPADSRSHEILWSDGTAVRTLEAMGHIDVAHVRHTLPDGRLLFDEVSFRVGDGARAALIGDNGAGKSTLLRLLADELTPEAGSVVVSGGLGVMPQFIGSVRDDSTVRDLMLAVAPPAIRAAAAAVDTAELAMMESEDDRTAMAYAQALADWGDAGGYAIEVLWDTCTTAALGLALDRCQYRMVRTLSGGEQKRLVLEALLRGADGVLLLDEPDNYLDVPGKRWLEEALLATTKTVLFVSHDRELLARTANRLITIEAHSAWVHGGGFASYPEARRARIDRLDELHRRWEEEHQRLEDLVNTLKVQATISEAMAGRYRAMQTRLAHFEAAGPPPERPQEQKLAMRLRGGRTGVRAITCERLGLTGLVQPFDAEIFFGERVAVLGGNGSGKSHFLRLLGGDEAVAASGEARLGARVVPGLFAQTHEHPDWIGRTLTDLLLEEAHDRGRAISVLRRYGLDRQADQRFDTLSGGQQARFQVLLLEIRGATLLLLDEPTDNLDLVSAEALEEGLRGFEGTVVAVTHDRWFARSFDRYLVFGSDGTVRETLEPVWDEVRPARAG